MRRRCLALHEASVGKHQRRLLTLAVGIAFNGWVSNIFSTTIVKCWVDMLWLNFSLQSYPLSFLLSYFFSHCHNILKRHYIFVSFGHPNLILWRRQEWILGYDGQASCCCLLLLDLSTKFAQWTHKCHPLLHGLDWQIVLVYFNVKMVLAMQNSYRLATNTASINERDRLINTHWTT